MSYDNLDCYANIIGLSQTVCECYDENLYNESDSGLYLDEFPGLNLRQIKSLENCEDSNNIWMIMSRSRDNAIKAMVADMTAKMLKSNKLKRPVYTGGVGQNTFKTKLSGLNTYAGVRFFCSDVRSGVLRIKSINTIFEVAGTFDVYVYDNNNTLIDTISVDSVAGRMKKNVLTTPLELPLHDDYKHNIEYFFVYQYNTANKPYNNMLDCGCNGHSYIFDTHRPYFTNPSGRALGWSKWSMVGGWSGAALDFNDLMATTNNQMNGLTFDVEFSCKVNELFCKDSLNYETNVSANTMAFAVQAKATEILLTDLLFSDKIDRYTMMNGEQINMLIQFARTKYTEYLDALQKQIDVTETDCLVCKDFIEFTKTGIFS